MALPFVTPNELSKAFEALSRRLDSLESSGLVVPENVSAFKNDAGYLTKADLKGYATKEDLSAVEAEIPTSESFATAEQLAEVAIVATEASAGVEEIKQTYPDPDSAVIFKDLGVDGDGTRTVRLASPIPPLPSDYETRDYSLVVSGGRLAWEPK